MLENIIKPKIEDSLEIAKLIKDGWKSAYKGIISDYDLENMDLEKMAERWKKNITNNNDIYIYKENNQILGVVRFGKAEEETYECTGEIYCLYVKPQDKRKGIGTQLFNYAKNKLFEYGYEKMIVWCLKGNKQGSNFYKKCGGDKIKERDYIVRGIKVREEGFMFNLKDEEKTILDTHVKLW